MPALREFSLDIALGRITGLRSHVAGTGAPKVLALHGWLDNAASFVPLLPWLERSDVVALDLPGHGASAHRAPGYDYAFVDWIHDVLDAMDALGWERADWLGHSMGGAIASMVAAAAPDRVRRLALVEALGPIGGDPSVAGKRLADAVAARRAPPGRGPRTMPDIATAVAARLGATRMAPEAARLIVERNLRAVDGGFAWRSDPRLTLPSALRLTEETVQSVLRTIRAPVLLVAADPPPPYFPAATRDARIACLGDARVEVVAGGHHLHMEQPGRVGALLRAFLD